MKKIYVQGIRGIRYCLSKLGLLVLLDRWAARSQARTWLRSLLAIYDFKDMVALNVPWWTFDASKQVRKFLATRPGALVFEWGSGASTIWLSRQSESVTAVEHDPNWASELRAALPENVFLALAPPIKADDKSKPVLSKKSGFEGLDFTNYVKEIDRASGNFDLIVIDGRAREACLMKAVERLASGGMIVFDNVERRRYRKAIAELGPQVTVVWTYGLTPCLPYPTRTALITLATS